MSRSNFNKEIYMKLNQRNRTEKSKQRSLIKETLNHYDPNLARIFLPWAIRHPKYLRSFIRLRRAFKASEAARNYELANGVKVPPFLIISITPRCNLKCAGCYATAAGNLYKCKTGINRHYDPLTLYQWRDIIAEASKLGVFGFILTGGEPFLVPELIDLCREFQDRFFIILTNGTAIKNKDLKKLKKLGNIAVLVSFEGGAALTDSRRGAGVYDKAMNTLGQLNKNGVLNGISVTITRLNYRYWLNPDHINDFLFKGIRIGVFIEYIPLTPAVSTEPNCSNPLLISCPVNSIKAETINELVEINDHALILTHEERELFRRYMLEIRDKKPLYIIHSPGDEEYFGGCVSAGRGFAHITPTGDLTPCPVSNIATHNLTKKPLLDALASPLFKEICKNEQLLETDGFPCALFAHPKEVDELTKSVGAYRTDILQK